MKKPYIVYSLSKDRTTQKFNRNKIQEILEDIDTFFRHCTTANITEPKSLQLTAYTAYDDTDPAKQLNELLKKTTERFGECDKAPIAFHFPSGEPHSTYKYVWAFPKERLQEAVQYIIDNSPMPISNFGPLELLITYHFNLIDTTTGQELLNQVHKGLFCI